MLDQRCTSNRYHRPTVLPYANVAKRSHAIWDATVVANHSLFGEDQSPHQDHEIGEKFDRLGSHLSRVRMSFTIRERETSHC